MCARIVSSGMQRCVVKNIYTARRRKAPLPLRFGAFMGRRLNFSAGREYAVRLRSVVDSTLISLALFEEKP